MSFVATALRSNLRNIGVRAFATNVSYEDMGGSKHDFVSFVNTAVANKSSPQAAEMHNFLVKCFVDNDSDYDGYVSLKGFNSMIHEAALAPRRFGFAPHTREIFSSESEFNQSRKELYESLAGSNGRISLDAWVGWANAHVVGKVGDGLGEHTTARWERNEASFKAFFDGVKKESSSLCKRSSTSTQYKEFYILANQQFVAADVNNNGFLGQAEFNDLVVSANKIPGRFGLDWFSNSKFSDVAVGGRVTWAGWFAHCVAVVKAN